MHKPHTHTFQLHTELHKFAQAPYGAPYGVRARTRPASLQAPRPATPRAARRRPDTVVVPASDPVLHPSLPSLVVPVTSPLSNPIALITSTVYSNFILLPFALSFLLSCLVNFGYFVVVYVAITWF